MAREWNSVDPDQTAPQKHSELGLHCLLRPAVEQIRRVSEDNSGIILNRIASGGNSDEYQQHMFLWRTDENYSSVVIKYPPYQFLWTCLSENLRSSHNTMPKAATALSTIRATKAVPYNENVQYIFEPEHNKTQQNNLCSQQRLRSAWTSA